MPDSPDEVICEFMSPDRLRPWWDVEVDGGFVPCSNLTLDLLWEVEERLRLGNPAERLMYHAYGKNIIASQKWHASAEQKIKALAIVLAKARGEI